MKGVSTLEELREHHQKSLLLIKGSPAQIIEQLRQEERNIGFNDFLFYFTFSGLDLEEKSNLLRRLAREIAGPLGWLRKTAAPAPKAELELQPA